MTATARQLCEFLEWLRDSRISGFEAGDQQFLAAHELMETVVARGEWPGDAAAWRTLLAPVLCCSPAQQDQFYDLFRARFGEAATTAEERKEERNEGARQRRRWVRYASAAAALILLTAAGGTAWRDLRMPPRPAAPRPPGPPQDAAAQPAQPVDQRYRVSVAGANGGPLQSANVYYAGQSATTGASGFVEFRPAGDSRSILVTHRGSLPSVQTVSPAGTVFTLRARPGSVDMSGWRGWWVRHIVPVAAVTGFFHLLVFVGWLIAQLRRDIEIRKWTTPLEPKMRQLGLRASVPLFRGPEMRKLAVGLRKRRPRESAEVAPEPTAEATARAFGYFSPVLALRTAEPEYLALGERKNARDHLARLHDELFARLRDHDVAIRRYYFQSDPGVCSDAKNQVFTLSELAAIHPDHELWIACEADRAVDPVSGDPEGWVNALCQWSDRVLLSTTQPAVDLDMRVAAPTRAGLESLTTATAANGRSAAPYPSVLRELPERWLEREPPPPAAVARLMTQLRRYLGEPGFLCLQACAVYPAIAWNITLTLVSELAKGDAVELVMDRLSVLPWFRHGMMPDWLRLRLIAGLKENESRVRAALKRYLETTSETIRKAEVLDIVPQKQESGKQGGCLQDRVYLAFVEGRKLDDLSAEAPSGWRMLVYESLAVRATILGVVAYGLAVASWTGSIAIWAGAVKRWTATTEGAPRPAAEFPARLMDVAEAVGDKPPDTLIGVAADLLDRVPPANFLGLTGYGAVIVEQGPQPGFLVIKPRIGVVESVAADGSVALFGGARIGAGSVGESFDLTRVSLPVRSATTSAAPSTDRPADWPRAAPESAWCYQEEKPVGSFGVHCHWSQQRCDQAKAFSTTATACVAVGGLSKTGWRPTYPGYMESWYQLGLKQPLPAPFPQPGMLVPRLTEFDATGGPQRSGALIWVDDNLNSVRTEIDRLRSLGYSVVWCPTGGVALDSFAANTPMAVISDVGRIENGRNLPTAGFDTLSQIRKTNRTVRFYFYTSPDNAAQYRDQALKAGATGITADPTELFSWFSDKTQTTFAYDPAQRVRPLRPGYQIRVGASADRLTAGTFCALVTRQQQFYLLTAWHVLFPEGVTARWVWQPDISNENIVSNGDIAGGSSRTAAIARLTPAISIDQSLPDGSPMNGVAEQVQVGARVKMFGATSSYVEAVVVAVGVTIPLYVNGKTDTLDGMIALNVIAKPGDFGAPVLTMDNRLIGMLYAGSDKQSFVLPIGPVLKQLNVSLLPAGVVTVPDPSGRPQQQQQKQMAQ
jgi:CheY-like chemotaxis protein